MCSMQSQRSLPVLLASELSLPEPVDPESGRALPSDPEGGSPRAQLRARSFRKVQKAAVTPYQALPIQGPLVSITHHLTPALPVVEPGSESRQVCPMLRTVFAQTYASTTQC